MTGKEGDEMEKERAANRAQGVRLFLCGEGREAERRRTIPG